MVGAGAIEGDEEDAMHGGGHGGGFGGHHGGHHGGGFGGHHGHHHGGTHHHHDGGTFIPPTFRTSSGAGRGRTGAPSPWVIGGVVLLVIVVTLLIALR
ncbi:hypothetical protein [Saccharopolyspora rosea]|uniref:MYXO-CTERM domain-containing protein n=1 Tax=Saccharopolyspora rosea TaxID=524884 RepID=A0ABW3FZL2_9PSEU|nr:hypothetical protein [Saccharopolyspora rosea]